MITPFSDRGPVSYLSYLRTSVPLALATVSLALAFVPVPASASEPCPNQAARETQKSTFLPDCRAYELVSPVAKNGTGVVSDSQRTRAAADGSALQFLSLGAFADAIGTGIATDYVSERTATPGTQGWSTHAITPPQTGSTFDGVSTGQRQAAYVGEFDPSLSTGVFYAGSPVTDDPSTTTVPNLYLRDDLLTPGAGTYALITHCPLCDATRTPLPAPNTANDLVPELPALAWMSPDSSRVVFESQLRLTADTPAAFNRVEVYAWDRATGTVVLAGRVPRGGASFCDDVSGPACAGSQRSIAGQGATNNKRTPDVVSDGTDGHTRVFFTFPTASGLTPDPNPNGLAGQVYLRVDGRSTVQLNVSERSSPDVFAPATFLDASADGERAFFMTSQALTDDAPVNGDAKIYMYDTTKPPSAPDHLTLINADHEPGDGTSSDGKGIAGLSRDGSYVYFASNGQIVNGEQLLGGVRGLYLWHDGVVRYITAIPGAAGDELFTSGGNFIANPRQARVTSDGRWLLYRTQIGATRQLFLYGADSGGAPVCVSCDPSGAPSTADSTDVVQTGSSATKTSWHENHALAVDGSRVFFDTAQALVPEDVNGRVDVYEYDVASGRPFLISTGTSPDDSWFMDASLNGGDVFFTTRQQLVGWDVDQEYDVYDARIGGGFPDPPLPAPPCVADTCRTGPATPPPLQSTASATFTGTGNAPEPAKPSAKPKPRTLTQALRTCRKQRSKKTRGSCERKAHRQFTPKKSDRRAQ
jgi:hypothetical protein